MREGCAHTSFTGRGECYMRGYLDVGITTPWEFYRTDSPVELICAYQFRCNFFA